MVDALSRRLIIFDTIHVPRPGTRCIERLILRLAELDAVESEAWSGWTNLEVDVPNRNYSYHPNLYGLEISCVSEGRVAGLFTEKSVDQVEHAVRHLVLAWNLTSGRLLYQHAILPQRNSPHLRLSLNGRLLATLYLQEGDPAKRRVRLANLDAGLTAAPLWDQPLFGATDLFHKPWHDDDDPALVIAFGSLFLTDRKSMLARFDVGGGSIPGGGTASALA